MKVEIDDAKCVAAGQCAAGRPAHAGVARGDPGVGAGVSRRGHSPDRVVNRVVIAGASAGGLATAEALRRLGYAGVITLVGAESRLPYDRPPLSKQILSGQWTPDRLALRSQAEIDALNLDLRLGVAATGVDVTGRTVALADGDHLPYEGLVVATGVRPRRMRGSDGIAGVHTLRTLEDAVALKARLRPGRRLVIVGAGFVGAEVAAVAQSLGVEVTMLEAAPVPLGRSSARRSAGSWRASTSTTGSHCVPESQSPASAMRQVRCRVWSSPTGPSSRRTTC